MSSAARNENGGATEVDTAVSATSAGSIRVSDTLNLASAQAITQRCVEHFKTVRIFEEILGGVPVKNFAGRFRNADRVETNVCPRCLAVLTDEARCGACGRHQ